MDSVFSLFTFAADPGWVSFMDSPRVVWFVLIGLLFAVYAALDGFDLGVGILHLSVKTDADRRALFNAIAPFWDGNEVWLIAGGGALFAAFPNAYATVFSGFYFALALLLAALLFRGASFEFRNLVDSPRWKSAWDIAFCASSATAAFILGVAAGNIVRGVPLGPPPDYACSISFFDLLNPMGILFGVTAVSLFAMHGAIYIAMRTDGELLRQANRWIKIFTPLGAIFCFAAICAVVFLIHVSENYLTHPVLFIFPVFTVTAYGFIFLSIRKGWVFRAFTASSLAIFGLMATLAAGLFPRLVPNLNHPDTLSASLTIYNAASSPKTLFIMLVIAAIGMPLVIAYTGYVYWTFRGKMKTDKGSY